MEQEHSLINGTIVKGIGGFYYVEASGIVYECKAKGQFRKNRITPMVGDSVMISRGNREGETVIREILPRINEFVRPPVANVEISMIVAASAEPEPVFSFIDKLLVMSEKKDTEAVLVFNKCDLISPEKRDRIRSIYRGTGYPVLFVSTFTGEGIEELRNLIKNRRTMMSGASGVGKSSIANSLGEFGTETGLISRKTQRGKHTTRHVELLTGEDGTMIFDTPGFTSFEILDMKPEELKYYYPEFEEHTGECRFSSCMHVSEPDCSVKYAVEEGSISSERYESYVRIFNELKEKPVKF
ncbi:MAG: ribosome small subunit-dependent GTPase A [Bacillota bacterium]|nr:ribosome small subunit-dependent GTPase A [Bacillota bacterium]